MSPMLILSIQLIIASSGGSSCGVWGAPYVPSATFEDRPRLEALFSSSPSSFSSLSSGISTNINTSKRQQAMPTVIDSGDSFAYRQHHQPPIPKQQADRVDEGYYGQQHESTHFRRLQGSNHHHQHPYQQPLHGNHAAEQQDFEQQPEEISYAFPGASSASAEIENEIGDNPFFGATGVEGGDSPSTSSNNPQIAPPTGSNNHPIPVESIDLIRERLERIKEEEDIEIKSDLLMRMLEQMPEGPLPIVYIEDASGNGVMTAATGENSGADDSGVVVEGVDQLSANADKRSGRYYRRYPWKRQNARSRPYDADARYLCVPSREDVFKLLVGIHENRIGNHQKTINFCNRKRPAKAIFTNIRFLG